MKFILILGAWCLHFIQIIESRMVRMIPDDEIYPYTLDKSMPFYKEYYSIDHLVFEQIDDDAVKIGGYAICIKSMDPKLPLLAAMRSQYVDRGIWYEGPLQLIGLDTCAEAVNPSRVWYNFTKLWTPCPPQKGDKWEIETQILNIRSVMPPSTPLGKWRAFFLFTQGLFGGVTKFGAMAQVEFIDV